MRHQPLSRLEVTVDARESAVGYFGAGLLVR
jgi:hypothetical protein